MNQKTQQLGTSILLTGSYVYYAIDISNLGNLGVKMVNQILFQVSGATSASGDNVDMKIQEHNSYLDSSQAEEIGWVDKMEDSTAVSGELSPLVRSVDLENDSQAFGFDVSTHSGNVRIGVKGQGTLDLHATLSRVS